MVESVMIINNNFGVSVPQIDPNGRAKNKPNETLELKTNKFSGRLPTTTGHLEDLWFVCF